MPPEDRRLYPWTAQGTISPLTITGASGSWFFDSAQGRMQRLTFDATQDNASPIW